jgi:hypothetical protein
MEYPTPTLKSLYELLGLASLCSFLFAPGWGFISPSIPAGFYLRRIAKSTGMNSINLFSYLSSPFHFSPKDTPFMVVIGFESGKKRGLMEKLFPFLAR